MSLPKISSITSRAIEPVDPAFFTSATNAEWDAYLAAKYPEHEGDKDDLEALAERISA